MLPCNRRDQNSISSSRITTRSFPAELSSTRPLSAAIRVASLPPRLFLRWPFGRSTTPCCFAPATTANEADRAANKIAVDVVISVCTEPSPLLPRLFLRLPISNNSLLSPAVTNKTLVWSFRSLKKSFTSHSAKSAVLLLSSSLPGYSRFPPFAPSRSPPSVGKDCESAHAPRPVS